MNIYKKHGTYLNS